MPTIISGTDGVDQIKDGSITASDFAPGLLTYSRNKIINGKMDIAQRGASFPAASGYCLDRFAHLSGASAVATVTQSTDVPNSNEFLNSYRSTITTANTTIAPTDASRVLHPIEGYNARDLIGKTFTLSFWVRSSKTGIHCVSLRNAGADRSYIMEYTILTANTWEYKTLTVTGGLITAGTWNWANGIGLNITWMLAAGVSTQSTPNAWQTGNFIATSNQVNCLDTIGNIFAITGAQLEVGSVATPFEHRPYGQELALCQRYYNSGIFYVTINSAPVQTFYPVTMRVAPTVAGGGAGFVVPNHADKEKKLSCSQTTPADQTLTFSAEL